MHVHQNCENFGCNAQWFEVKKIRERMILDKKLYLSIIPQIYFIWDLMFWPCGCKLFTLQIFYNFPPSLGWLQNDKIQKICKMHKIQWTPIRGSSIIAFHSFFPLNLLENSNEALWIWLPRPGCGCFLMSIRHLWKLSLIFLGGSNWESQWSYWFFVRTECPRLCHPVANVW